MRTSFEAAPETDGGSAVAVAEPPERQLATQDHWAGGGQVEGEVDAGDIRLPRINLTQKSGKLGEDFAPGSFVFNKEILISNGPEPFELVALRIRKQYQEALPYDPDGPTPKVFNTSEEVKKAGGHFNFEEKAGYYKEIAHILCLVGCPEGVTDDQRDYFMFEHEGNQFALAMWTVTGSAYTSVAKALFTAAAGHLRAGLQNGKWTITSEKRSNTKNTWFTPIIRAAGKTTPEFQKFAESLLG